jgi:peptidoglycan hydrolase-like protein with peptidoglycan-binding domain
MADIRQKAVATADTYDQGNIAGLDAAMTRRLIASTVLTESHGGDLAVTNKQGYVGRYQAGAGWLADAGYVDADKLKASMAGYKNEWAWAQAGGMTKFLENPSNWNNGLSLEKYKASDDLQDRAFKINCDKTYQRAVKEGVLDADDSPEKVAGFLKARHISGYGGAVAAATGGRVYRDSNGTSNYDYMHDITRNRDGLNQHMSRGERAQSPSLEQPSTQSNFVASPFLMKQTPEVRAYLDLVAWKEVSPGHSLNADGSPGGYRDRNDVKGSKGLMPESAIADNGTFPRDELRYNVGRYQMKQVDVDDMRRRYDPKIDDFSPESQDRIAVAKMKYRDVIEPLQNGDIRTAIKNGGKEWASLPGSPYGQVQEGYTADKAVDYYNQRLAFHRALDKGQTLPAQAETRPTQGQGGGLNDALLLKGERGEGVKQLQEALNKAGIRDAQGKPLPTTGNFGDMTDAAVRKFQDQKGLEVDGKAGKDTLTALGIYPGQQQAPKAGNFAEKTEEAVRKYQEQTAPGQGGNAGKQPSTEPAKTLPGGNFGDRSEEAVRRYQEQAPTVNFTDKSLISNPAHPDNKLYQQALSNLEQLGPSGGFKSRQEMERAAAAVAVDAKATGLQEINHISRTAAPNGQSFLVAVQGDPTSAAAKNSYIDYGQAVNQTLEQSTKMAQPLQPSSSAQKAPSEEAPVLDNQARGKTV